MTIDRDDPTPPRVHRVDRPDGRSQAHQQAEAGRDRTADELDAFDDRGQGSPRSPSQDRAGEDRRG